MPVLLKKYFPHKLSEQLAFLFILVAVCIVYFVEINTVIPYVHKSTPYMWHIHYICATFVVLNILGNFSLMIVSSVSSSSLILPSLLKPDWRFCAVCEALLPPRSFHCNICRKCVLKRDHHCTFAGCCIGYNNIRYFWLFLFYLTIGLFYATSLNMFYIWDVLGGFSCLSIMAHILPFIFWVTGNLDIHAMFLTLISVTSITGSLFVGGLLAFYTKLILKNQTSYEKNHNITLYDLGWKQNIKESFGSKWYLVWLCPFVKSTLPGNGIEFMTNKNFKLNAEKTK